MKIQSNFIISFKSINSEKNIKKEEQKNKKIDGKTINPQEYIGRSMVNFKGKENPLKLTEKDNFFVETVAQSLKFSENDTKKLKNIVSQFLEENNYETLREMTEFEQLEDRAVLCERVINEFNLNEMEDSVLLWDLAEYIENDEDFQPKTDKYVSNYGDYEKVAQKYDLDFDKTLEVFHQLAQDAEFWELETIFDTINKNKNPHADLTIIDLRESLGFEEEKLGNFLIDLSLAGKSQNSIRKQPEKMQTGIHKFYRNISEECIAKEIVKNYDLKKEARDFVKNELEKREDVKNGAENIKAAFIIAENFELPIGAEKIIVNTINYFNEKDVKFFDKMLLGGLISDNSENNDFSN